MILVGDIVEYGLNSFGTAPARYRVSMHLKRAEDKLDEWQPKDIGEEITKEICLEFREEDRKQQKKNKRPFTRRYHLIYCRPKEATHVSLVGIGGTQALISDCKKIGQVTWNKEHLKQVRKDAISKFWLKNYFVKHWYWE